MVFPHNRPECFLHSTNLVFVLRRSFSNDSHERLYISLKPRKNTQKLQIQANILNISHGTRTDVNCQEVGSFVVLHELAVDVVRREHVHAVVRSEIGLKIRHDFMTMQLRQKQYDWLISHVLHVLRQYMPFTIFSNDVRALYSFSSINSTYCAISFYIKPKHTTIHDLFSNFKCNEEDAPFSRVGAVDGGHCFEQRV